MKKFYLISGLIIALGSLNYAGLCIPKGRFLTNEEKFLAVLEYHNNRVTVPYWVNEGYPRQIKYESVQKYLKENPDCCWTGGGGDAPPPTFFERITGDYRRETINVKFKFRYYNEKGKLIVEPIQLDNRLTNCGELKY